MMDINGASVAPIDPSRLPYNPVGFPVPLTAFVVAVIVALVATANHVFLAMSKSLTIALILPLALICVAYFLFVAVRAGVHAALRMDAHDAAIDEQVMAYVASVSRGHLSPERVAKITQGAPE